MIYLTDYVADAQIEREIIGHRLLSYMDKNIPTNQIKVLLVWHKTIDEKVLASYPNLKAIVRYGVGFDNIDIEQCKLRGIKVFNNPDYGIDEVSDTALAMIMALARNIVSYDYVSQSLVKNPNKDFPWQENVNSVAKRLRDCSLGVIGVGRIGSALALKIRTIVGSLHFFDPYVVAGYEKVLCAKRHGSLKSLLKSVDIVSIHIPLSMKTTGFIDKNFIDNMRKGSILVNTARGGLLANHTVLDYGLKTGRLSGVGLDVLPEEPVTLIDSDDFIVI